MYLMISAQNGSKQSLFMKYKRNKFCSGLQKNIKSVFRKQKKEKILRKYFGSMKFKETR